jgi:hypothetical protein
VVGRGRRYGWVALVAGSLAAAPSAAAQESPPELFARPLTVTIQRSAGGVRYAGLPASIPSGLVAVTLVNHTGSHRAAQLVRYTGHHTARQALAVVRSNSLSTPGWVHAEGGPGSTAPGTQSTTTVQLVPGRYLLTDLSASSRSASARLIVTPDGQPADLPGTFTTIEAAKVATHRYRWRISGPLHPGDNEVTFRSGGGLETFHTLGVFKVRGNPSRARLLEALNSDGGPPSFVVVSSFFSTTVLDGGKSQVTQVRFSRGPGRYVLFDPLSDRRGGRAHFNQGLLTTVFVS